MVKNNRKIKAHLKKINRFLNHLCNTSQLAISDQYKKIIVYLAYFYEPTLDLPFSTILSQWKQHQVLQAFSVFTHHEHFFNTIEKNSSSLDFFKNQLDKLLTNTSEQWITELWNYHPLKHINQTQLSTLVNTTIKIFVIDQYIKPLHKKIDDNLNNPNYETNIQLIQYQLTQIKDLQNLIKQTFPKDFNNLCVAINLLINQHY